MKRYEDMRYEKAISSNSNTIKIVIVPKNSIVPNYYIKYNFKVHIQYIVNVLIKVLVMCNKQ